MPISLRQATHEDLPEMKKLYVGTITTVCTDEYTPEQIAIWASSAQKTQRWIDLIEHQLVLIARKDNKIVGFCSLDKNIYIDFMYVHKDYQRQGIAETLLLAIEDKAGNAGTSTITSDISKTARPFFERKGYKVIKEQINIRQGIEIINYKMSKDIKTE